MNVTTEATTSTTQSEEYHTDDSDTDFFFMVGVVTPLVVCCFAIFFCAVNSLWKTRQNLARLSTMEVRPLPDYTEFTIDITTKMDSCIDISSALANEEESVLL